MALSVDTGALVHGGKTAFRDDPAELLPGFPNTDAILQSRKSSFSPSSLGSTVKVYSSTTKASIIALGTFYAGWGATYEIEEGPIYKITVTLPYDEFTNVDQYPLNWAFWEIIPNQIDRSIFDVGIYSPSVSGGQISSTRQKINLEQKAAVDYAAKNPTLTVNLSVKNDPDWTSKQYIAQNFLALSRLKADSMMAFTQTLKRSVILNAKSSQIVDPIQNTNAYGNFVVAKNDLISLFNIPIGISPYMRDSYSRLRTIQGQDGVTLVGLAGYLVKPPTLQLISPNKIQLTQEFVWDEWLDSLYYPYNGNYSAFPQVTS